MKDNPFVQALQQSANEKKAVMSVNILNYNTARACARAAQRANQPIIFQPSVGTVKKYGVGELYRMVACIRETVSVRIVLHLDHCVDAELARACIDAGWDSVMMDYSARPLKENIALSAQMVAYAHQRGAAVEGEVGIISGVEDEISHDAEQLATFEETDQYVHDSGIDAIAPAIGTAHGLYKGVPKLNFDLVKQLSDTKALVVVHGGTGLREADFKRLINCGASKINISTALKIAYLGESRKLLKNESIAPVTFDMAVEDFVSECMEKYIRLFAGEEVRL